MAGRNYGSWAAWVGAGLFLTIGFVVGWLTAGRSGAVTGAVTTAPDTALQSTQGSADRNSSVNAGAQNEGAPNKIASNGSSALALVPEAIPLIQTLAETAEINSEFLQSAALYTFAAPLDAEAIRELIDVADQSLVGGDYDGATYLLIGRYAELDFSAALDYALNATGPSLTRWLQAIFHARARIDLDDAVAVATDLGRNQQRIAGIAILRSNGSLSATQRQWVIDTLGITGELLATTHHNLQDGWAELRNISNPMQRLQAQYQLLARWAKSDPWAALAATSEIENAQYREGMQGAMLAAAAADDPQRAIDWLNAYPAGELQSRLTIALVSQLGAGDLATAERLIEALPESQRGNAGLSLWSVRAATDPEGAAAWVQSLDSAAGALSSSRYQRMAPAQILSMLSMTSSDAAERFMAALPDEQRNKLEPTYVKTLARSDPQQAARRLAKVTDSRQYKSAARRLVRTWARSDPQAASRWVESQSRQPGAAAATLYRTLGQAWPQNDLTGATRYARRMLSGSDRDQLLNGMLGSGLVPVEEAQSLLNLMADPTLRAQSEKRIEARESASSGVGARLESIITN